MSAQKGSAMLIKIGNGGGLETFTALSGLRVTRMELQIPLHDATTLADTAWRELQEGSGKRMLILQVEGIFMDSSAEETLRTVAFNGSARNYQLAFGNGDTVSGAFLVARYARAGKHDGEETYALTLESAGAITFMAG